jgi:hypothetical protein
MPEIPWNNLFLFRLPILLGEQNTSTPSFVKEIAHVNRFEG